ncbi:hypothetical protein U9M73_17685 [Paenibacillus phoenicis]|uniref:Uncharacterized protein n=1 Tax=Paenibacillus phoenicis TaxID=554117 RepID=A0ABU5PPD8_9BACL|nr:hypothetical protein [Paenibacillus phoenicis]MEA3571780.1 hypothetical protein [Paenibacillus phoenicis]
MGRRCALNPYLPAANRWDRHSGDYRRVAPNARRIYPVGSAPTVPAGYVNSCGKHRDYRKRAAGENPV